ncbi:hypothetical protein TNCV_580411 [Trichonephila clavipes]|nr:hypothetical protein TNCV_580411 [Trichonephila clavipes]
MCLEEFPSKQSTYALQRQAFAPSVQSCVPLTVSNREDLLLWSQKHQSSTPQEWRCVIFSDESKFTRVILVEFSGGDKVEFIFIPPTPEQHFTDDITGPHRSLIVDEFLEEENICRTD